MTLIPLVPISAGAESISFCTEECPTEMTQDFFFDSEFPAMSADYEFEGHLFRLTFDEVFAAFSIMVTVVDLIPETLVFGSYECVPYGPEGSCVSYDISSPTEGFFENQEAFYSGINILIAWLAITDLDGPGADTGMFKGPNPFEFNEDVTDPGSYFFDFDDPGVRGLTDSFSAFAVGSRGVVPEPGLLLLMGAGVGAALLRRRRRARG